MYAENFSLDEYLKRIGFEGEPRADAATLGRLMFAQLCSVPFENLDVQAGKVVSLVPEEIVEKVIGRGRGGYCYELNGLFAMALEQLGIPYRFVAARPMFYPVRRPRTHMAIIATADGSDWLCDLGFGSYGIREPLRLDHEGEVRQGYDTFRLGRPNEREYLLQALVDGEWTNQYAFDLSHQEWIDFAPANWLNSTHPDTVFVQKPLVLLFHPEGRTILFGDSLKLLRKGEVERRAVSPGRLGEVLREQFGLEAPAAPARTGGG